jgi:hypothetical protein
VYIHIRNYFSPPHSVGLKSKYTCILGKFILQSFGDAKISRPSTVLLCDRNDLF